MQSIVIVDDETIPRKIAEKALKDKYVVSAYADARTALSELTVTRPNLLLVDLHMPDMDGYAILNEIRQLEDHELSNVPVVIMTSDDDAKNEIKGFDLGAYDYIRKPLLPDVLIRRVDRIMKGEETLKHLEKKAEIDILTGLLNRSASIQQINENLKMRRESGLLLMMDLDHFKLVNDRYGHEMGDKVLSLVANTLKKFVRSDDVLGRIGGDEFVIFYRGFWKDVKSGGKGGYFVYNEDDEEEKAEANIISLESIQKRIENRDFFPGAYMVDYNDFCSIYHFIKRSGERGHIPVQMVLFTVEESEDVDRRGLEERMQAFGELLSQTIRRGDVVVRCSNKQYMILLVGTEKENSLIAIDRVMQKRSEEEKRKYPIHYEINTLIS